MVIYRSQNPGFFGAEHRTTVFTVCQVKSKQMRKYTVDERNPAPPGIYKTL